MTVDESNQLSPYERELLKELTAIRSSLQTMERIWEKMADA